VGSCGGFSADRMLKPNGGALLECGISSIPVPAKGPGFPTEHVTGWVMRPGPVSGQSTHA
jgi:hypothetical protein